MWNKSSEGWGGRDQKIGKALVLKAVDKTIELGWPRLDLYTWGGNTKAVPLYKKCGFFWEEHDRSTHLMNFMPTVLHTEAVHEYFQEADWYKDSLREIEIKVDGRQENDFHYFEYHWEKIGKSLRMEFEREGKGLRLIETDDYLISATVEDLKLIFGHSYTIRYEIINKSGKPLSISLTGQDDKNITFDLEKQVEVMGKEVVEGQFYVGQFEEDNEWRSRPCVNSKIMINGQQAEFKLGIIPQFPVHMGLAIPGVECYKETSLKRRRNESLSFPMFCLTLGFIGKRLRCELIIKMARVLPFTRK